MALHGKALTGVPATLVRGETSAIASTDTYSYDDNGNLIAVQNGRGYSTGYSWDLFDRKYTTGGQLGSNGFTAAGNFIARGLPANANGDFPISRATLLSPGAPRTAYVGVRYTL